MVGMEKEVVRPGWSFGWGQEVMNVEGAWVRGKTHMSILGRVLPSKEIWRELKIVKF